MPLKTITPPTVEPVSLQEAKAHLRAGDDEDLLITAYITAAREVAEHDTGRATTPRTLEAIYDAFPEAEMLLGMPPVLSVVSISYVDPSGALQVLPADAYYLDADTEPGYVLPAAGRGWPATMDTANAVRVRFTAGYATPADVPASMRSWMLLQIGALYRDREAHAKGATIVPLPNRFVDRLLDAHKVY